MTGIYWQYHGDDDDDDDDDDEDDEVDNDKFDI